MEVQELYSLVKEKSLYIIDIGASHAPESDPIHSFLTNKEYKGLCIEPRNEQIPLLKGRIAETFSIHNGFLTPLNVVEVFNRYNVPESPDIIKIDIDGYDLEVIRAILGKYKPKIIIAEINEKIPPPILFEVKFKEEYRWDTSHFYGFSIASGDKVMKEHDYSIYKMFDLNNILCVNRELSNLLNSNDDIKTIYKRDYIDNPRRTVEMPWNSNVDEWLRFTEVGALKYAVQFYFEEMNERSNLAVKTKKKDVDFILDC